MDEDLKKTTKAISEKAHQSLTDAKILLDNSRYESASSRAYYAVFHMMQACLLTKNLSYSKHSGVISGFSRHFVKSGIFPKDFSQAIRELRKERELGDYDYEVKISKEKAIKDVEQARRIAEVIEKYLMDFMDKES